MLNLKPTGNQLFFKNLQYLENNFADLLSFSLIFFPAVIDSDHDDEVASLASSSGNCGPRSSHRLPVKDWKTSPRSSPKLKRKSKKDEGWVSGPPYYGNLPDINVKYCLMWDWVVSPFSHIIWLCDWLDHLCFSPFSESPPSLDSLRTR